MPDDVVLINAFEVPAGDAEAFIAAWEKTRDYLRTQPGYVDTALHPGRHIAGGVRVREHRPLADRR